MHTFRTRFKNEIVAEFLPPARATKKQRVIILADGAPSTPNDKQKIEFFSKKGFWAFHFRYRGSWESDGKFLKLSPEQDIIDILDGLPKGFREVWGNKRFKVKPDQTIVVASSFGGTAGVLASIDPRINKVVAVSPMLDWTRPGPDEPYPKMIRFFSEGFGGAYRLAPRAWQKLQSGKFFNPINHTAEIEGSKLLIIHAKDDRTCPFPITKQFAEKTNAKLVTLSKGDHMSSSIIMKPRFFKMFQSFIKRP